MKNAKKYCIGSVCLTLKQWEKLFNISASTLRNRINQKNVTILEAICIPNARNKTYVTSNKKIRPKEYKTWCDMKARCYNPKSSNYKNYGGRGIKVCDEWINSYEKFLSDMDYAPTSKHTIDRIDNNKNYCKENCKWSTRSEQSINRRKLKSNTTGTTGVYWNKKLQKYTAGINIKHKHIFLGTFETIEEAIRIRKNAEEEYH